MARANPAASPVGQHGETLEATRAVACPSCGSWAVKADRSLAGRMVCARCGQPLGRRAVAGGRRLRGGRWPLRTQYPRHWRGWLGVGLVVAAAALLAALPPRGREEGPTRGPSPRSGEPGIRALVASLVAIR